MKVYVEKGTFYKEKEFDKIAQFIMDYGVITELNANIGHNGSGEIMAEKLVDYLKENYDINAAYSGTAEPCGAELYYVYDTDRFSQETINKMIIELNREVNCSDCNF